MLSVFPIMFLSLLAHAILRVVTGGTVFFFGFKHLSEARTHAKRKVLFLIATVEIVCGALLTIGLVTQVAALVLLVLSLLILMFYKRAGVSAPARSFFVLLLGISSSLLITGAGTFAFDMPF